MRPSRAIDLSTGLFVLLGFAAMLFLVTQITNREFSLSTSGTYRLSAQFENVGGLKVGAPVSMSGVTIGRVESIGFDMDALKAAVTLRIDGRYNRIPEDSDASIFTAGLLGGQYIGITPGGAEEFLQGGAVAFRLELLVEAGDVDGRGAQLQSSQGIQQRRGVLQEQLVLAHAAGETVRLEDVHGGLVDQAAAVDRGHHVVFPVQPADHRDLRDAGNAGVGVGGVAADQAGEEVGLAILQPDGRLDGAGRDDRLRRVFAARWVYEEGRL